MLGAVIGDIVGSVYEHRPIKTKDFPLFSPGCGPTDDSVMTIAVAEGLLNTLGKGPKYVRAAVIEAMQKWGRRCPDAGYGARFTAWLGEEQPKPYNSWGNGSAMRVSAAGWLYPTIQLTTDHARYSAEVSHNHPEGVRGAEVVAAAIFLLRQGKTKTELKNYIRGVYRYDLNFTVEEIRPGYSFDISCQGTVPAAIVSFLDSDSFEDCIRNAVSLGGDSDTLAAIAGSIAEAYYEIPRTMEERALAYLDDEMKRVYERFKEKRL
ncbi:MAG: ADP-ribosylglycohydrolase family protein [Bacillota bacterium]|jgi:ADP-ribosylglycohydrolase